MEFPFDQHRRLSQSRLCRVLFVETTGNARDREFTRHSPELGIVPEEMGSYEFADSGTSAGLLAGQFDGTSVDRRSQ
jgi:hypothetical protein